jgi:hypothetical protein
MNELETIFEISKNANGILSDAMFRMAVGVIALVYGIIGLSIKIKNREKFGKSYYKSGFITFWSIMWLSFHIPLLQLGTSKTESLLEIYQSGKCSIVEGMVEVLHEQPSSGHDSGDEIKIGSKTFTINYFTATPAYKKTISHGGVLRQDVYAKLHHYRGKILKVEIKQKTSANQNIEPTVKTPVE